MNNDKTCGTCKFSQYSNDVQDFICTNVDSDYIGLETEYSEPACMEYESK